MKYYQDKTYISGRLMGLVRYRLDITMMRNDKRKKFSDILYNKLCIVHYRIYSEFI